MQEVTKRRAIYLSAMFVAGIALGNLVRILTSEPAQAVASCML